MSNRFRHWAPTCSLERLRVRARLLETIRAFFAERGVLEVETPLLGRHAVTDRHLTPFESRYSGPGEPTGSALFLQTSPEFAMKRLLAAGSGSIYQICKAFRNEELGRWHNPEFTLLEWYRVGFGLQELIDEVDVLLTRLAADHRPLQSAERFRYADVFERYVGTDPVTASFAEFDRRARDLGFAEASRACGCDRATWLDFLFSHAVQPHLGCNRVSFVDGYPACLPSLARTHPTRPDWVERVEVFLDGVELANGFHELVDAAEQERRFDADNDVLQQQGKPMRAKDQRFLAALQSGLPNCSGIALGLDRLLMLLTGATEIAEVLTFPLMNA